MRFANRLPPAHMRASDSVETSGKFPRLELSQYTYALILGIGAKADIQAVKLP